MKKINYFLFLILFVFVSLHADETSPKVVGYYPSWAMYRKPAFKPEHINADLLTHINYAFVKVDTSGNLILVDSWADTDWRNNWNEEAPFFGNFKQLQDLKKSYPHLKTLISVGGWTLSDPFPKLAADPEARKNFAKQCVLFCDKYGFDGVDIDWEYPGFGEHSGTPDDKTNFTLLLKELHTAAKAHSPELLVTIAAPAGTVHMQNIEIEKIHPYLDWFNLMCYDFVGAGWTEMTNHHAALYPASQGDSTYNCESAVKFYLSKGVPASKLVVGMPLYGRSFAGVDSCKDGLFCPYKSVGSGTTAEAGILFFSDIKQNVLRTYDRFWDDKAKVPYLFNPRTREFVTYEDEKSLKEKCRFITENGLGGAMVWELGMDIIPSWPAMKVLHESLL